MGWDRLRVVAPEGVVKFVSKLTEFYPSSPYATVFLPLIDKDILASSGLVSAFSASSSIGVHPVRLIPFP